MQINGVSTLQADIVDVEYPESVIAGTEFTIIVTVAYSSPEVGAFGIQISLGEEIVAEDTIEIVGDDTIPFTYELIRIHRQVSPGRYVHRGRSRHSSHRREAS